MDLNELPTELAEFVKRVLENGKYASEEELMCAALRSLQEKEARSGNGQQPVNGHGCNSRIDVRLFPDVHLAQ